MGYVRTLNGRKIEGEELKKFERQAKEEPVKPAAVEAVPSLSAVDNSAITTARAELEDLHHTQITEMVVEAGGTPAEGSGSKAKNVDWLIANVND